MKRFSKSSKLLSVLLAATIVLAGCNNDSGDTKKTTEGSDEEVEQTSEKEEEPSEDKESEGEETGEQRVLKVDSFSGGNGPEAFKALKAAFEEKYPDIKVELRFERELDTVLNKENATGEYSDVVYYNLGQPHTQKLN